MEPNLFSSGILSEELKSVSYDFKASVVAGEIIDHGVPQDIIFFKNLSIFKRFVSKEIENISWDIKENEPDHLVFELNREGLYDMLPEAVVHARNKKKKEEQTRERFNEQKQQEKNSRKFFSPIENEFARRILHFDIIEREIFKNSNPVKNREFFEYFFDDSKILSDAQVLTLMYILPLSHKIRGNLHLISQTISRILNYKTVVTKKFKKIRIKNAEVASAYLGNGTLGVDTIVSDQCAVYSCIYDVNIYEVPADEYPHFIEKGKNLNVINFILPFLFPVSADVNLNLFPIKEDSNLQFFETDSKCFLGFNSYI